MEIAVLGIDLGKNSCSVVGLDGTRKVVMRWRINRTKLDVDQCDPASHRLNVRAGLPLAGAMHRSPIVSGALAALAFGLGLVAWSGSARAMSDPLEPFNRAMFVFNDVLLDYVVTPMGNVAETWLSPDVRQAGRNMYANLSEPEFIVTNLLQGNVREARISLERVAVNTIWGIAGVYDRATEIGLITPRPEPGEAMCGLGVPAGAYLVLPIVGPANVNSTIVLTGLWVGHLYVIGLISTTLLYADIAVDVAVGAALLRHSVDPVDAVSTDPYNVQRFEYSEYIDNACTARPAVRPMG
jgi:phospholipid-binding lipoprotein MlaA